MVLGSDPYKGMTAKEKATMQRLQEKRQSQDSFFRAGEEEFSQAFSAQRRSVTASADVIAAADAAESKFDTGMDHWNKIMEMFKKMSGNDSGFIEKHQLKSALSNIGMDTAEMEGVFRSMDTDHNGHISIDEFVDWMRAGGAGAVTMKKAVKAKEETSPTASPPPQAEVKPKVKVKVKAKVVESKEDDESQVVREALGNIFKQWDANGDGQVSRTEFHGAMAKTGLNAKTVDKMFDFADGDKSGFLSIDEFINWAFKEVMPVNEFRELNLKQNVANNVMRVRPMSPRSNTK
mmetsp:Transcript_31457/g.57099  ORF Transcript_31457/g.57099 Transcript_31457/m.57099 type:complete len:291 (-) Transcript_31457:46-918(-)